MVQIHFRKVTLLSSTNLYEVLENVEHTKRLPAYKRSTANAHRVGSLVLQEVVITCNETTCIGEFWKEPAGPCRNLHNVHCENGSFHTLATGGICAQLPCCMAWDSDLILSQWCSSIITSIFGKYRTCRFDVRICTRCQHGPGSSGYCCIWRYTHTMLCGSKFTLPLQVNFCALWIFLERYRYRRMAWRIRCAVVAYMYGHMVSLSERTADKWE